MVLGPWRGVARAGRGWPARSVDGRSAAGAESGGRRSAAGMPALKNGDQLGEAMICDVGVHFLRERVRVRSPSVPVWVKSSKCEASNCVEVADIGHEVLVRSSVCPDGPMLRVSRRDWGAFVAFVADVDFACVE